MTTTDILRDLIAFPTVSKDPNLALIRYCEGLLRDIGAEVTLIKDATGQKANLYATIGPTDRPGVLLSGHTDVVPVDGQPWSVPPFEMTQSAGRIFGRGAHRDAQNRADQTTVLHRGRADLDAGCHGA